MFDKMNRQFAYGFQGGDWQGWTPPWVQHEEARHGHHGPFGPREFWMQRGHGPFGPRGPFGSEGPFGSQGRFGSEGHHGHGHGGPERGRRFFGRGDVKFALLQLLQERPMHGYEMMKALEEKSGGFYAPSAGSIYPTLQMLEDRGLVSSSEAEGKKVYSITDAGRAFLKEQGPQEESEGPQWGRGFGHGFGPGARAWSPEMQALRSEAAEVARLLVIAGRTSISNPEQLAKVRAILENARKSLSDIIYGSGTASATPTSDTRDTDEGNDTIETV